ncbi:hypothetical protein GOV06_03495 [Candidatus Woesearchaeota archaeon]|nr:hypothetical protein [Candidatus Woesearchaeota archaeon]
MLAITLLLIGCKQAEQVETQPDVPVEVPAQEGNGAEDAEPGKIISSMKCVEDRIQAVIKNTGDTEATMVKDIKVILNGLLVVDPVCEKLTLAPGEETQCQDISGHIAIRTGKVNSVQINLLRDRAIEYVDCSEEE